MTSEQMQQLRDRITRARAAIARDQQELAAAKAGRDEYEVRSLEWHIENRRVHLAELLEEQAHLAAGGTAAP